MKRLITWWRSIWNSKTHKGLPKMLNPPPPPPQVLPPPEMRIINEHYWREHYTAGVDPIPEEKE